MTTGNKNREELKNNELELVFGGRMQSKSGTTVTCEKCGKKHKPYVRHTCVFGR